MKDVLRQLVQAQSEETEVVIVGAGPTGLTAAVRLAQLGIPHVVVDSRATPTLTSNAALVHASSLELLGELGVGNDLVAAGRVIRRIVMVDRGRPLVRVELTDLPSRYPFALGVPQSTTEELLLRRLGELGGSVRRLHRVQTVQAQVGDQIVAGVDESSGNPVPFEIRARYVVGADGSHSTVRSAIGLAFPGETYDSAVRPGGRRARVPRQRRRRGHDQHVLARGDGDRPLAQREPPDDCHGGRGCDGARRPGPRVRRCAAA